MKIILTFLLAGVALISRAQTIPPIVGETVDNKVINIPVDLKGKYSLLCLASSQKAEPDLETWLEPVYRKFIAKTGLMDEMYDIHVYFIPVLTGTNISFAASMKKKFKENSQADLHSHVLFCSENGKQVLSSLKIQNSALPHFFLLDKDGKIIFQTEGRFTEEKIDAIDDLIEL